jgi:hypothetical protein
MFDPVRRTILIVEDEQDIQDNIVYMCGIVQNLLRQQGLFVDLHLLRARTLDEANQIIDQNKNDIDLITIDIALKKEEKDLTDDQLANLTPGGLQVLQRFVDSGTMSIIYSGEKTQTYIQDAYVHYGVLRFIRKSKEDEVLFPTIKTALWYLTAIDSIMLPLEDLDRRDIQRAEQAWQHTVNSATEASIRISYLPYQLDARIAQVRAMYLHPDTDLPSGEWTQAKLRKHIIAPAEEWKSRSSTTEQSSLSGSSDWMLIRCKMEGFHAFISEYASQKPALLQLFANAIGAAVSEDFADKVVFVGHLDRDFLQDEPYLIIILRTNDSAIFDGLTKMISQHFAQASSKVLPSHEVHERFDPSKYTFSLQFKHWSSDEDNEFYDLHSTLDIVNRS